MIRQAAKWLKDYKGPASIFSMVKDFSWNQDSLSCIKSMVDNRIAVLYQILHTAGRRVKRTLPGNLICHIMGQVKSSMRRASAPVRTSPLPKTGMSTARTTSAMMCQSARPA